MRNYFWICLTLLSSVQIIAQQSIPCSSDSLDIIIDSDVNPWTNLDFNNKDCQFQFAIVTDRTGGHRPGVFMDGVTKLNLLQPEFVMSVGDLIEGYTEDTLQLNREWDEFEGFVSHLTMPFFYTPGNHDITNAVMADLWKKKFGRTYYHFLYKDVLFLCLDSEDQYRGAGRGTISDPQYQYIENTLAKYPDVRWTLVFMHQPLWTQENPERWPDVEKLLSGRKHTVFVGHNHNYVKYARNNGKYFILATTGGGSRLRGPQMGEFDHVVWVTMTQEGPIMANLLLEGIWNEDVMTAPKKEMVRKLLNSNNIQFKPLFIDSKEFSKGTYGIKLTNDQNIPMQVTIQDHFGWDLRGRASQNEITIPPNSVEFIDFALENRTTLNADKLRPLPISLKLKYDTPDMGVVEIPFDYQIKPLHRRYLPMIGHPVQIDGVADEWKDFTMYYSNRDLSDNQIKAAVSIDDKNLYLAARIKDDQIILDTSAAVWHQDCFSWIINVDSPSKLLKSTNHQSIRITPSNDIYPSSVHNGDRLPPMIKRACRVNEMGYDVEVSIPIEFIEKAIGAPLEQVRVNFFVDDKDVPDESPVRLHFEPEWRSKESWVGSGLFMRQRK